MSRRKKFNYSDSEDTEDCSSEDTCRSEKTSCSSSKSSFCPSPCPPCPPCPKPRPGKPGKSGCPGKRGCDGNDGKKGPTGPRGIVGRQGSKGERGPKGPKGDGCEGRRGPKGNRGEKGDRGNLGKTGPVGPKGPQGPGGGTIKCIEIPFYGLGGPSNPKEGPTGCSGASFDIINNGCLVDFDYNDDLKASDPIKDIYFLGRGTITTTTEDVELYLSTGELGGDAPAPPACEAIHPAGSDHYFERGTEPKSRTDLEGCCGEQQTKGYIWSVTT